MKNKKKKNKLKIVSKKVAINNNILDFKDIHDWGKYYPKEPQYVNFEPYINATAYKIIDVYTALCHARTSLMYIFENNYGKLIHKHDKLHLAYIRSLMWQNALFYYNTCIDFSLQVLLIYSWQSSFDLYDKEFFEKLLSTEINLKQIQELMNYNAHIDLVHSMNIAIMLNSYKIIIRSAFYELKIREKYNYLKHRGAFYFDGLGINDKKPFNNLIINVTSPSFSGSGNVGKITYSGELQEVPLLYRDEIDINYWADKLKHFDDIFVDNFNLILHNALPNNYLSCLFDFKDWLVLCNKYYEFKHSETYTREKKAINKKQITFKIDINILERLDKYINNHNVKKIDVVEEALKEYLDKKEC